MTTALLTIPLKSFLSGKKRYPDRIIILNGKPNNIGVSQNINQLLAVSSADYTMFCDHDDVWLPNKIEITLNKMLEAENENAQNLPILVHTDLKVVDENLNTLCSSFFRFQNINPTAGNTLSRLLVQNCITGCTVLINKALREKIGTIPDKALMHDWWAALVASIFWQNLLGR